MNSTAQAHVMAPTRPTMALKKGCRQLSGSQASQGLVFNVQPPIGRNRASGPVTNDQLQAFAHHTHSNDGAKQHVCGPDDQPLQQEDKQAAGSPGLQEGTGGWLLHANETHKHSMLATRTCQKGKK
jgi:hypothetical protein